MSKASNMIRKILPTVLTVLGSGATIAAVIFAAKEGPKFKEALDVNPEMSKKDKVVTGAKVFGPAIGCAAVSVACGVGAHCMDLNTQASLTGAYVAVQQAYKNYRLKNGEINGEEADISVREAIEEEKLPDDLRNEKGEKIYTVHFGYFEENQETEDIQMTKEELLTAIIRVNKMLDQVGELSLNGLREMFGLSKVDGGDDVGWSVDMLCDWVQSYQLNIDIYEMDDGSLFVSPMFPAYGGYLSDYGLDY